MQYLFCSQCTACCHWDFLKNDWILVKPCFEEKNIFFVSNNCIYQLTYFILLRTEWSALYQYSMYPSLHRAGRAWRRSFSKKNLKLGQNFGHLQWIIYLYCVCTPGRLTVSWSLIAGYRSTWASSTTRQSHRSVDTTIQTFKYKYCVLADLFWSESKRLVLSHGLDSIKLFLLDKIFHWF